MDVSIIIVNYNTLRMTRECIDSLVRSVSAIDYEIILVDNASSDGSREYFSGIGGNISSEPFRYVYNASNLGFGTANNVGLGLLQERSEDWTARRWGVQSGNCTRQGRDRGLR